MTEALTPIIKKRNGLSLVWLIPIVAAIIGAWLIFHTLNERGPLLTITFRSADGIEVQKTKIKYKSLDIGVVEMVSFSNDFSHVEVRARLNKEAAHFLRAETRFWVVRPSLSMHGISGLGTLLSGAYLEIEPGIGDSQTVFKGLETPPVVTADQAGKRIKLLSRKLGSIDRGSLLYYQGIVAGEVLGYELQDNQRDVTIYAFVKAPFERNLRSDSLFWHASGIDVSVGPEGMRVKTESVRALLFGGIAFDTPESSDAVLGDAGVETFTLHDDLKSIREKSYANKIRFVMYFRDSLRGLNVGAPVEFKGMKIGSVVDIRLEDDSKTGSLKIPVLVELEPDRILSQGDLMKKAPLRAFQALIKRGLRGRLQAGSLLTGQLFIDLDMQPDEPARLLAKHGTDPELPTVQGNLERMTSKVRSVVEKLDKIDFAGIGLELQGTLKGTNALANNKDIDQSLADLAASLATVRSLTYKVERRAEPIFENLDGALSAARGALEKTQTTLTLVDSVLDPESPSYYALMKLARELSTTARSVRTLVDLLERDPQSLILGRRPAGETK